MYSNGGFTLKTSAPVLQSHRVGFILAAMNSAPQSIQHRTCYKCHYEAETAETRCPRCRSKKLWTRTETRAMGGVLAVLGSFLMVVMGAIILFFIGLAATAGKKNISGPRFSGTKNDLFLVFIILGFVFFFGFVSFVAGMWQIILGRRNMVLIWVILALGVVFLVGGSIFRVIVGD